MISTRQHKSHGDGSRADLGIGHQLDTTRDENGHGRAHERQQRDHGDDQQQPRPPWSEIAGDPR